MSPSCSVAYGCAALGADGSDGLDASGSGFGSRHCVGRDASHVGVVSFGARVRLRPNVKMEMPRQLPRGGM